MSAGQLNRLALEQQCKHTELATTRIRGTADSLFERAYSGIQLWVAAAIGVLGIIGATQWSSVVSPTGHTVGTPLAGQRSELADQPRAVFQPSEIPAAASEIANPMRGSYIWYDNDPAPPSWPMLDSYSRFSWRELEPRQDRYDFSEIERSLNEAQQRGGKFGFRVMAADSSDGGSDVPEYVMDRMPQGFWFRHPDGESVYAPDWNAPVYMERAEALVAALGSRFGNDPRLGFVDIGLYGDFGEWHVSQWPYRRSTDAAPITSANARKVVEMHVQAFPNQRLVIPTANADALGYALDRSPRIGLRVDCLGEPSLGGSIKSMAAVPSTANRWQTAPMIVELCGPRPGDGFMRNAVEQVQTHHVAMIGNGNFGRWDRYSRSEQTQFTEANKTAGYRFVLEAVELPESIRAGTTFDVQSAWSNVGVTPAYNAWAVTFDLRRPATGEVVWEGVSQIDLQSMLPTQGNAGGNQPVVADDSFTLPAGVPAGQYELGVTPRDSEGYYAPLALAIEGRNPEGRYALGLVSVDATGGSR
jgi:hypothetical protein